MAVPSARSIAVPSVFTDFTGPSVPSVPSCFRLTESRSVFYRDIDNSAYTDYIPKGKSSVFIDADLVKCFVHQPRGKESGFSESKCWSFGPPLQQDELQCCSAGLEKFFCRLLA